MADPLLLAAVTCLALANALGWCLRRSYRRSLAASLDGWSRTVELLLEAVQALAAREGDLADLCRRCARLCNRIVAQSALLEGRTQKEDANDEP